MDRGGQAYAEEKAANSPYPNLAIAAKTWPTAARDFKGANSADHVRDAAGKAHLGQLPNFVEHLWYTPNVPNGGRTLAEDTSPTGMTADGAKRQVGLENQARQWATPRANEGEKAGNWQKSGDSPPALTLTGQAIYSRLARQTVKTGKPSSKERRSLNPLFVEWLMGWPPGWTLAAWTDLGCSATALSLWRQRMRCALFAIASPPPAPPVQVDLLG